VSYNYFLHLYIYTCEPQSFSLKKKHHNRCTLASSFYRKRPVLQNILFIKNYLFSLSFNSLHRPKKTYSLRVARLRNARNLRSKNKIWSKHFLTGPVAHLALLPGRTPAVTEQQSELNSHYV
jgi:hypothetical protein